MNPSQRVIGYLRVSTEEQANSGAGLDAQHSAIQAEVARREWCLVRIHQDAGVSGKSILGRPGLHEALEAIERGDADTLMVAKLDRLSRSLLDFAGIMDRSRRKAWSVVALDLALDTTTPSGELMANVLATFAQFERRLIGQRTRDALAEKRRAGVRLGRPAVMNAAVRERIQREREAGASYAAIARELNAAGVETAHGGTRWYPSTIRKALQQPTNP